MRTRPSSFNVVIWGVRSSQLRNMVVERLTETMRGDGLLSARGTLVSRMPGHARQRPTETVTAAAITAAKYTLKPGI